MFNPVNFVFLYCSLVDAVSARLLPASMRMPDEAAVNAVCPCEDVSMCQTPTVEHQHEFFGFGGSHWQNFDWSQVTTVAWATDTKIICEAHKTGARIIAAAPSIVFSSDPAERHTWIEKLITTMKSGFFDGVTFDYESPLDKSPGSSTYQKHLDYVALVNETTSAVHAAIPGSQISVCAAWSPDDIDGRNYDYAALASASDLLYMMVYDTRSQIYGKCIASANSPLAIAERGVTRYQQLGVPAKKLILGTPWYGYDYPCTNSGATDDICEIKLDPFRGVNCSDAAGTEVAFMNIMNLFDRGVCPFSEDQPPGVAATHCEVTTGVRWDESTQSPYFNYMVNGIQLHQVWFDNATSSALKYSAAQRMGVRGVGPFTWDELDVDGSITGNPNAPAQSKSMWEALKAFRTSGIDVSPDARFQV